MPTPLPRVSSPPGAVNTYLLTTGAAYAVVAKCPWKPARSRCQDACLTLPPDRPRPPEIREIVCFTPLFSPLLRVFVLFRYHRTKWHERGLRGGGQVDLSVLLKVYLAGHVTLRASGL